jgi:polyferredoxin
MREEDLERQSPTPRVTIRRSRAGRWRALALVLVHVLIAIHIAHWWSTGSTMTPLEPSESMEFAKHSVVNAGLVFFALMIGSTLIFGRWFCGWACHIVALQDACRWILMRVGIRPRMVNLGILGVVPWLAFVYMFLAPLVDRILHGDDLALRGVQMTRADFWGTFPPWPAALLTFAFCGFAIVYFLGSKAFCNYGCPYGAIFGIADQLAPIRIRVTDACEGCGHCTAVCSSNVRVHQEVRDYGMVVDPGCMKCLDCVSVCPKDALYVGAGTPAILARERAHGSKPANEARAPSAGAALRCLLLLAFTFATLWEFEGFTGDYNVKLCAWLTGITVAAAALFRGKARRKREYTLVEEVLLAGFFLLALLAFRGWKGLVPFLFSLGLSAILAYMAVQVLRLAYANNVGIQRWRLRASGHWTRGGVAFVAAMAPVGWLWFDAGWTRHRAAADHEEARASFDAGVKSVV